MILFATSLKARVVPAALLPCFLFVGCDSRSDAEKADNQLQEEIAGERSAAMANAISNLDRQDREWAESKGPAPHGLAVCKASIGILMSQDPRQMRGQELGANRFSVSYRREDGTSWEYRCEATTNRLRWRPVENGQEGRERQEDDIRYAADGSTLTLSMRGIDGEDYSWKYRLPQLVQEEAPY